MDTSQQAKQFDLLFGVVKSVRYHNHRRAHYERLHQLTNVAAIITAGYAFLAVSEVSLPIWTSALGMLSALLAAFDLVIGYSRMADCHRNLSRRFSCLEQDMGDSDVAEADLKKFTRERLEIEKDEPPIYRALDVLCDAETCRAFGCADERMIVLSGFEAMTANWYRWTSLAYRGGQKPAA